MPAVFDQYYVKRLQGTNVKRGKNKRELAEHCARTCETSKGTRDWIVSSWCGVPRLKCSSRRDPPQSLAAFEKAMEQNDQSIAPSMLYAYARSWRTCRCERGAN